MLRKDTAASLPCLLSTAPDSTGLSIQVGLTCLLLASSAHRLCPVFDSGLYVSSEPCRINAQTSYAWTQPGR